MKTFVLALLFSSIQGAKINQSDLSPEAFAQASVQARIEADAEIKKAN
jgi:hypothetical protein